MFYLSIVLSSKGIASNKSHKFYHSLTEVYYNSESQSLEIIIKLFTDDIEKALELKSDETLFLGSPKQAGTADQLMESYLKENFRISQSEKRLSTNFLGFESEQDYTHVYLEVEELKQPNSLQITNTILFDLFDEQVNEVNCNLNGTSKRKALNPNKKSITFEF